MTGGWSHGLFNCCAHPVNCLCVCFLPCVAFGNAWRKMGKSCIVCGLTVFCPIAGCVTHYMLRQKVRHEKHIDGTALGDCASVWCCPCCSIIQIANEVDAGVSPMERH